MTACMYWQPPILPPISTAAQQAAGMPLWTLRPQCTGIPNTSCNSIRTPPGSERAQDSSSEGASPHTSVPNTPALSADIPTRSAQVPQQRSADDCGSDSGNPSEVSSPGPSCDIDCTLEDLETSMQESKDAQIYTGVSRSGLNGRWRAQLSTRGRTVHLGTFASAEEAAQAWDRAAVQERGKAAVTNFAISDYINSDGSVKTEVKCASQGTKGSREADSNVRGHKSFRGVYHSGTYGRWKARIVVKGHKIHLGTFASAEDAARAWDLKAIEYRGAGTVTNFDASNYATGKVVAPCQVDAADSEDEDGDKDRPCGHRKRSLSNACASPSHSELSDLCTPRATSDMPPKKRKHDDAHSSPRAAKTAQWAPLSSLEQDIDAADCKRCARVSSQDEHVALTSLLSLCAAAEAMS